MKTHHEYLTRTARANLRESITEARKILDQIQDVVDDKAQAASVSASRLATTTADIGTSLSSLRVLAILTPDPDLIQIAPSEKT